MLLLNDNGDTERPDIAESQSLPWYRRSHFVDYFAARFERKRRGLRLLEDYRRSFADDNEAWIETRGALEMMKGLSESYDFDLVVAIFPVLWELSDYPLADIHAAVCGFLGGIDVPCIDMAPWFEGYNGPELWVHPNNVHPNEIAQGIAADAIFDYLQDITGR